MFTHPEIPTEVFLRTESNEDLKEVFFTYSLPKGYTPDIKALGSEIINRAQSGVLSNPSAGYAHVEMRMMLGGFIEYHNDPLLSGLPHRAKQIDAEALCEYPGEFQPYLGVDITRIVRYMLQKNIVGPHPAVIAPTKD